MIMQIGKNYAKYKFIEAMILVHGQFNRTQLMRAFNIGEAAASRVISDYAEFSGYTNLVKRGFKKETPKNFKPLVIKDKESPRAVLKAVQLLCEQEIVVIEVKEVTKKITIFK